MGRSERRRSRPGAGDAGDADALLAELGRLYAELDQAQAGASCPASTECCRFARTRREPWVTSLEIMAVERARRQATPPRGRPVGLGLPLFEPMKEEGLCPMLGADGKCVVYAWRPLGCRTFFCDRATLPAPLPHKEMLGFVRRLKELAEQLPDPEASIGRPLRRALTRA